MKKIKIYLSIFAIVAFSLLLVACQNKGKGSVPTTNNTTLSVDVCLNQDCDYSADGQSDEREISKAVNAVLAAGGGTVNIKSGSYDISSPVNIALTAGKSLIIKGDGYNTILTNSMSSKDAAGRMFVVTGSTTTLDSFIMRDLYFVGTANSGAGVYLVNINKVEISSSKFYNFSATGGWGVGIKTSGLSEITLTNDKFNSNTNDILIGDAYTAVYGDKQENGLIFSYLPYPRDGAAATSTGGSLKAGTYYFKLNTISGAGGQSALSDEFSCTVGGEMSGTSTLCSITWSNITGSVGTKIWMATTSETYYSYYLATTTSKFTFATSTGDTAGTLPTKNTAYLNKLSTSSDSWIMAGNVGIGTTTPSTNLHIVNKTKTSTSSIAVGSNFSSVRGLNCLWNGSNYTLIYFGSNSITPIYATSTSCN